MSGVNIHYVQASIFMSKGAFLKINDKTPLALFFLKLHCKSNASGLPLADRIFVFCSVV